MTFNPEFKGKFNSSAVPELTKIPARISTSVVQAPEMKVSFGKQLSNQDNSLNFTRIKSEGVPKNVNSLLEDNINLIKNLKDDMSVHQLQLIKQIC